MQPVNAGEKESLPAPTSSGVTGDLPTDDDRSDEDPDGDPALATIHVGRRVPVYRKLGESRPKQLREIMHRVLTGIPDCSIPETLPEELRKRQLLISRDEALRRIHFPAENTTLEEYERSRSPAHRRLIFEDFFWLALGLLVKRGNRIKEEKGTRIRIDQAMKLRIKSVLPFGLTDAQRRVVKDIFRDLQSDALHESTVAGRRRQRQRQ